MKTLAEKLLMHIGVSNCEHIVVHSSYKKIRAAFYDISINKFIESLQAIITSEGSLIMPAFTYCFKRTNGSHEIFDRLSSPSKTGAVSEVFRTMPGVVRTSSPTHSFSLWGKAAEEIGYTNSPESPLGRGSVLEWLEKKENSYVLLAGTNFSSLSFGHYLEVTTPVPWADYSPWNYMEVERKGVSTEGEQDLIQIPGCAKSFVSFEHLLIYENKISGIIINGINFYLIPVKILVNYGLEYFKNNYGSLLCPLGSCKACDSRHIKFTI